MCRNHLLSQKNSTRYPINFAKKCICCAIKTHIHQDTSIAPSIAPCFHVFIVAVSQRSSIARWTEILATLTVPLWETIVISYGFSRIYFFAHFQSKKARALSIALCNPLPKFGMNLGFQRQIIPNGLLNGYETYVQYNKVFKF